MLVESQGARAVYAEGVQGVGPERVAALLRRPIDGEVHFNDVFSQQGGEEWWRTRDFDAELTVAVETTGQFPEMTQIPIGEQPWVVPYGLTLVDDLVGARAARAAALLESVNEDLEVLHPDARAEVEAASKAVLVVANYAPRDDAYVAGGQNGSDFYYAISDNGTEFVVTPLSFLSELEERNRLIALYRIPTEGHPAFKPGEQFRSARIGRTRQTPEILERVFEYEGRDELLAAKAAGTHPEVVPKDQRTGRFAYTDKFGNVRLGLDDVERVRKLAIGKSALLLVNNAGKKYAFPVQVAANLRSAPLNELAVYINTADTEHIAADEGAGSKAGYIELIARLNGNPSLPNKYAAIRQLLRKIRNFDPATAEFDLVPKSERRPLAQMLSLPRIDRMIENTVVNR